MPRTVPLSVEMYRSSASSAAFRLNGLLDRVLPVAGVRRRVLEVDLVEDVERTDDVLVEFADFEARGLLNERPSKSCAAG
jgi:hypothetical protein